MVRRRDIDTPELETKRRSPSAPAQTSKAAPAKAKATKSAVAQAEPSERLAWARPGTRIVFDVEDFDAADTCFFDVLDAGDTLTLAFGVKLSQVDEEDERVSLDADGTPWRTEEPKIVLKRGSLDKAKVFLSISQASIYIPSGKVAQKETLPLFFPREAFASLVAGKSVKLEAEEWGGQWTFEPSGKGTVSVLVFGKKVKLPVLKAKAEDGDFAILDDPEWPLVLSRKEQGGDNGYTVTAISAVEGKVAGKKKKRG